MAGNLKNEQESITAAKQGDLDAFNQLVLAYQDQVFTVTYRIMGEAQSAADAAQETFITAFRRLETYRGGSFRAWLLRIATNTCYDILRYHKRRPTLGFDDLVDENYDDAPPIPDPIHTPEEAAQNAELHEAIQRCIDALNDDQRVTLVMSDIEGYSYQEIADTVGVQLGTVKSRLSRARASLRQCLQAVQELLPDEYRL
ncbi:MAG: sigma-70 family RNA polymerase sigma factor [Phototrophicales bacterium]